MSGTRSARFGGIFAPDAESVSASIDWQRRFAQATDEQEFMNSDFTRNYLELLRRKAGNELYLEGGFNTAFETDQEFENYQTAFGAIAVIDYKAWSDDSAAAKCNVFDYPAALGRWISGTDHEFTPSGAAIPTLLKSPTSSPPSKQT
ncbi:MAG: hypothetical protein H7A48_11620 [Akkermansiaceae bacterium]|nr:hypothetical protein [Akkermansiaceae bacterium]